MIKKMTIALWCVDNKWHECEATVYGAFAVHVANGRPRSEWKYYQQRTITHVATGRKVGEIHRSQAWRIAKELNKFLPASGDFTEESWDTPEYKDFVKVARSMWFFGTMKDPL